MRILLERLIDRLARIVSLVMRHAALYHMEEFYSRCKWHALSRKFGAVGASCYIHSPFMAINPRNMFIGNNFNAMARFRIEAYEEFSGERFTPRISIGDNVSFGTDCHIGCIHEITIGDNVLVASRVYISDHSHGEVTSESICTAPVKRKLFSKGPVIIKDNVWLGEGVVVMPGVIISENAIVGANAVVTKDVPRNAVVAGIPAKILKIL